MFRPLARSHRRPPRRGTSFILIVVSMLTLFAAVGMAYALYAMQEAKLGLARKDQEGGGGATALKAPDPTDTINRFFGTLIYDTGDGNGDVTELVNALRGHSLARSMYGRDVFAFNNALNQPYNANYSSALTTPWAGVGTFQDTNNQGVRNRQINYTLMQVGGANPYFLIDPEYMGERLGITAAAIPPFDPTTRTYVNKAAGYSYPDVKDFFAGAIDPANGQILVQSFHRDYLFGPLAPNNANWNLAAGRHLTLRPMPLDHPQFPRVPPNYDGTYTGDVQNWPGGYTSGTDASGRPQYQARNDSLWMNIGLPVITLPGNRRVQPLVAPLIVPLDGLLNVSAHGNTLGGGTHVSYAGYGPWEVNLGTVLGTDAATVVNARGTPTLRNGTNTRAYDPYSGFAVPNYAPVTWGYNGTNPTLAYPSAGAISGLPTFTGYDASGNLAITNHPALFSPTEWPGVATFNSRTFPVSDLKRLNRFAYTPDWYAQADVVGVAPNSLAPNTGAFPFVFNPGPTTGHSYRRDPTHLNRGLVTTRGFGLDRPKLVPNYANRDTTALTLNAGTTSKPTNVSPGAYPAPGTRGTVTDFAADAATGVAFRWSNALAALGSVNLNRPLADYRTNTAQPLSNTNLTASTQPDLDRQQLARDIFVRLVAALGGAAYINPNTGQITLPDPNTGYMVPGFGSITCTQQQYDALRYLAQLAVNVVDYIDNDDISTVFVWNPNGSGSATFTDQTDVGNRVVIGVEKSRLVINETYSEIVNDAAEPRVMKGQGNPTKDGHVRFWVELLNPTKAPVGGITDGTAQLRYPGSHSPYQLVIARAVRGANNGTTYLSDPANVRGDLPVGYDPEIAFTFANTDADPNKQKVAPNTTNAGVTNYDALGLPANGIALVGPKAIGTNGNTQEFDPTTPAAAGGPVPDPWTRMIEANAPAGGVGAFKEDAMEYLVGAATLNGLDPNAANSEYKRHLVMLRRLANPYRAGGAVDPTNPYVTVDTMDYVPANDGIYTGTGGGGGGTPIAQRFAIGKVQPYAGQAVGNVGAAGPPTYTFPQSMVLAQNPTTPVANNPKHTFGRNNGQVGTAPGGTTFTPGATPTLTDTIMAPFDWLVHMDRPLVNAIELFQVRDSKPHLVTSQFVVASGVAPGVTYDAGYGRWASPTDPLTRALEYLTVKPYTAGVAHGGRVVGQINPSAVQDKRVLDALLDIPPASVTGFDSNFRDTTAWQTWMGTREMAGVTTRYRPDTTTQYNTASAPGQTVFDASNAGAGYARPFVPFGAPVVTANPGGFAYGSGTEAGLLRNNGTAPYLYLNQAQSYLAAEPVRKIANNTTTVNHNYLVFLTIGYFDVVGSVALGGNVSIPQLGAEAYLNVPGDMRQKVVAVVDMSNMALDPVTNTAATVQPFFTTMESTAYAPANAATPVTLNIGYSSFNGSSNRLFVAADGQEVEIVAGNYLVIGHGADQQVVTVSGIAGVGAVSVTGMTRNAWGGSCVSNVRPGYPGPQPNFSYTANQYKPVIPYLERLK